MDFHNFHVSSIDQVYWMASSSSFPSDDMRYCLYWSNLLSMWLNWSVLFVTAGPQNQSRSATVLLQSGLIIMKASCGSSISLQMATAFDSIEKSNLSPKPQMLPSQYFTFKDMGRINDHMELNVDLSDLLLSLFYVASAEMVAVVPSSKIPLYKQFSVSSARHNLWSFPLHRPGISGFTVLEVHVIPHEKTNVSLQS